VCVCVCARAFYKARICYYGCFGSMEIIVTVYPIFTVVGVCVYFLHFSGCTIVVPLYTQI
jgi:hypothetical protein